MGTLILLALALSFNPTTIYGAVLLCWITQTGCGMPFQAAGARRVAVRLAWRGLRRRSRGTPMPAFWRAAAPARGGHGTEARPSKPL